MVQVIYALLFLCLSINAEHPHYEEVNNRQGKIFNRQFWDGFEKGIDDTMGVLSRVRNNLEVAMDQVTDNLESSLTSFADRIDDTVEESLPPFLRRINKPGMNQSPKITAITGDFDTNDKTQVYYTTDDKNSDENVEVTLLPNEDQKKGELVPHQKPIRSRNPFDIFNSPIFRPFAPLNRGNLFNMNIFGRQQWWQGNNVCIDREEIDEEEKNTNDKIEGRNEATAEEVTNGSTDVEATTIQEEKTTTTPRPSIFPFSFSMDMSSCTDYEDKYSCLKTTTSRGIHKTVKITYRCCHGFVRDGHACNKVELRSMSETLNKLKPTTDFLSLVKAADLTGQMDSKNLTIFVPTNEAIEEYTLDLESENDLGNGIGAESNSIFRRKREIHSLTPTLLGHMTEGFLYAGDMVDEMIVPTLNIDSSLRINIYDQLPPIVTVNCARLLRANQHSTSGVVHTIDKVIVPAEKTIFEIINSEPQFSILKKLINQVELVSMLKSDGQNTFFAPTDDAFKKLKPLTLESLLEGSSCLEAVIKQHILPNTICSTAIQGKKKTMNMLESNLAVERDENNKLTVEDANIIESDIVATNGVVHVIDKALMPNEAKSVGEILQAHNLTSFINLINAAGMMEELNGQKDITVFAPSNSAFKSVSEKELEDLKADKKALKELIHYHVTAPSLTSRNINNNHLATTESGHSLRINLYSTMPSFSDLFGMDGRTTGKVTVGCSRISNFDARACGAVVHVVERMLEIPKSNVVEELKSNPDFSIFTQMVKNSGLEKDLIEEGPFTVLVPSDHALKTLPEQELNQILEDKNLQEKIVRRHILKEHVCCSGISSNGFLNERKRTMDGSSLHVRRSYSGKLMAGPTRITNCGFPSENGVLHTVNRVLVEDRDIASTQNQKRIGNGVPIFNIPRLLDIIRF